MGGRTRTTCSHGGVARVPRERDNVPNVGNASHVHDKALKTQSETGVRCGAVLPEVQVPLQPFGLNVRFPHAAHAPQRTTQTTIQ